MRFSGDASRVELYAVAIGFAIVCTVLHSAIHDCRAKNVEIIKRLDELFERLQGKQEPDGIFEKLIREIKEKSSEH